MGSVRVRISVDSQDVFSTPINIDQVFQLLADGGNVMRQKVAAVAAGASALTLYKASDKLVTAYAFVRNLSGEKEDFIYAYNDANDDLFLKLGGGEIAFIPLPNDQDIKVYGTKVDQLIEFAVFGLDSSSVTLS